MTEQIRLRIDSQLAEEADMVCREIGITPTAAVSMFFAQMVKLRGLPFRPSDFPVLDEFGVTLAQATAAENSALAEIELSRKAGKLETFTGKL
ncbi:MAG: RelB antitoxin [Verrucomicrobiota bacterium]|jgi:addiction module RelB/DinJ family antitoxin|nr:type II toxin-antitoxin system RelB/DinJ family antitoxin [Verrucomicrobiota bacterium]